MGHYPLDTARREILGRYDEGACMIAQSPFTQDNCFLIFDSEFSAIEPCELHVGRQHVRKLALAKIAPFLAAAEGGLIETCHHG
jgi:hypothetical protein